MSGTKTALVLGATGGIGGETAAALLRHGWHVVAMLRRDTGAAALADATRVTGDASNAADVRRAAEGAQVIVHAVNPPGYRDWDKLVLPMIDNSIAAAKAVGARVVLPGTIYNYGSDAFPLLAEDSPQHPVTRKGQIRVELEAAAGGGQPRGSAGADRPLRRFLRPGAGQQLVQPGAGHAGQAPGRDHLSGAERHRPRLGLSARRGRDDRAPP